MEKNRTINIIALAALGGGLSGGDRIFIEFARNWSRKVPVDLYVWEEGLEMCRRENLSGKFLKIHLVKVGKIASLGFVPTYIYRILLGILLGLRLKLKKGDYIYSASEFWMDSLPALLAKYLNRGVTWVAAWYQTAPNPFKGFTEGKRENTYKMNAFFYWLMQLPIKPLIASFADFVLVNNDDEKQQFPILNEKNKVIKVLGAVKTDLITRYQKTHPAPKSKKYLAVFQGRFHPQKGVVELIDIWKLVTDKLPNVKLVMIGDGPLMGDVRKKIEMLKLQNNIELAGYLHDGDRKYAIFNNSKVVVHPAFYDSGGMAAAEAMAFGLPCVGFNLNSYKFYYPIGMTKVSVGDLGRFADAVIRLGKDDKLYKKTAKEAKEMLEKNWSWDIRASEILKQVNYNQ